MNTDFMDFKQDQIIDIIAKQKLFFRIKTKKELDKAEIEKLESMSAHVFSAMSKQEQEHFLKNYMLYISKDAVHWAPLFGSRAYREVLDFKQGRFSFGIFASATSGIEANIDISTVK